MTGAALVNMGISITDTVMMGWMGPTALAAGAVVSDLYSIVFYFMGGILSIVSPMVARAHGADRFGDARTALHNGVAVATLIAIPAFYAVWHAGDFIRLFGVDSTVISMGREYAHVMAFTIVPMLFVTLWRNMFDAIGRPRVYLIAILTALPANALANQVFMFGWGPIPALGLAGAGLASALVGVGVCGVLILIILRNREIARFDFLGGPWRFDGLVTGEIFRLGLPIGFFMIGEVGIFLFATVVVSMFGVEALAAHAVTLRIAGVIYAIPVGLSQAATVRVSHAIGSGDFDRLSCAIRSARLVGIISGLAILAFLAAGADFLPALFLTDAYGGITGLVAKLLLFLGLLNLAQGFAGPAAAILRGFKDTRAPMVLCLTGYWAIGMPVAYIGAFRLDYEALGIWIGLALGVAATAFLMNLRLHRRTRPAAFSKTGMSLH